MIDSQENKSPILLKISKIFSDFFNPLNSLFIYFLYYSIMHYTWSEALYEFWPILLILILPIILWIFWNVKKGKYTNADVSNREQRKTLYIFIAVMMVIYLGFMYFVREQVDMTVLFLFALLILMQISNFFIKSSMHTALNFYTAALFFTQSWTMGFIWLGISILVGVTRIILKRHTPKEVLMGAALSIIISFIYLYAYIQSQH